MIQNLYFFKALLFISGINSQVLAAYGDHFKNLTLVGFPDQENATPTWHYNGAVLMQNHFFKRKIIV